MINWQKEIWIASRKPIKDEDGYDSSTYEKAKQFFINYQPMSSYLDIQKYGEQIRDMYTAYVNKIEYEGKIKVGDKVYLSDGTIMENELKNLVDTDNEYCMKANYKVVSVLPQNIKIKIDFEKI